MQRSRLYVVVDEIAKPRYCGVCFNSVPVVVLSDTEIYSEGVSVLLAFEKLLTGTRELQTIKNNQTCFVNIQNKDKMGESGGHLRSGCK